MKPETAFDLSATKRRVPVCGARWKTGVPGRMPAGPRQPAAFFFAPVEKKA